MRKTVEETLNALLDKEAFELVGAERYERMAVRDGCHSVRYARKLITGPGEVNLSVPKPCGAAARPVHCGCAETLAYTDPPSTGAGSGRTTGSSASTARSGGGSRDPPGRQLAPHAGDGEAEVHSGA